MNLPKEYNIKSCQQKSDIIRAIGDALMRIDENKYPNVCEQLYNDNSKVELIENIIINMYSETGMIGGIEEIIASLDATMND